MSQRVRGLRLATWGVLVLALLTLGLVAAAVKGWVPRETVGSALLMFAGLLLGTAWLGLRANRLAVAEREAESHRGMVIVIAAQLGRQDDQTLQRIARLGGPAGEAATMILTGRRSPRGAAGRPSASH